MAKYSVSPTGVERTFPETKFIVSKTDLKGRLTYVNRTFMDLADYKIDELLGEPHSKIRHPDMPRCVFNLLWEYIQNQKEIFAYVVNMAANGDHYWVLAHVTPSYDEHGTHIGYHSNRRVPKQSALNVIQPIYQQLLQVEGQHSNKKQGMDAGTEALVDTLNQQGVSYDEFIFSIA